ncbi:MAG TPA: cation transporter [Gemmatimonadaceae bacterium]|nr:cation transporter [Gemmatimonadaceae bacterium]
MDRMTMKIDGMSCGHCVSAVTRALANLDGVQVEEVKVGAATVAFDPDTTSEGRITQAIEDEGYAVLSATR